MSISVLVGVTVSLGPTSFLQQVGLPILGVVENMSGLRHRLGDFSFMRRDGPGGAERDATAEVLELLRSAAPGLEVRWAD